MTAKNNKKRSSDEYEIIKCDFLEAFERLVRKVPRSAKNFQRLNKGKLTITLSSVAEEAGRSRSLIARSDTKYQEVRAVILGYKGNAISPLVTGGKKLEKIRQENLELKRRLELSLEAQAQLLFEKTRAERDSIKWLKAYRALQERFKLGGSVVSIVPDE